jgi:hypothetical protein
VLREHNDVDAVALRLLDIGLDEGAVDRRRFAVGLKVDVGVDDHVRRP